MSTAGAHPPIYGHMSGSGSLESEPTAQIVRLQEWTHHKTRRGPEAASGPFEAQKRSAVDPTRLAAVCNVWVLHAPECIHLARILQHHVAAHRSAGSKDERRGVTTGAKPADGQLRIPDM